jgi:replicative DNA helicase
MDQLEEKVRQIAQGIVNPWPKNSNVVNFSDVMIEDHYIVKQIVNGEIESGWPTPWPDLDYYTGGDRPGLTVWAGGPSSGKSSVMWQLALHHARVNKLPVGYIPLEMQNTDMGRRGATQEAGVNTLNIRPGKRGQAAEKKYRQWAELAGDYTDLWLCELSNPSLAELDTAIVNLIDGYGCKIIMVDYLQLINDPSLAHSKTLQQEIILNHMLNAVAMKYGVSVHTGSQIARLNNNTRPSINDMRWGGVEQAPDRI